MTIHGKERKEKEKIRRSTGGTSGLWAVHKQYIGSTKAVHRQYIGSA
jgi:hypothetical protein